MTTALPSPARRTVLLVTPVWPRANGFGLELRAFQWLVRLSAKARVHVLRVSPDDDAEGANGLWEGRAVSAQSVALDITWRAPPIGGWGDVAAALQRQLAPLLTRLDQAGPCRVTVFRLHLATLGLALAERLDAPLDLDLDDWESATRASIAWRMLARARIAEGLRTALSALRWRWVERAVVSRCHRVTVAAAEDVAALRRLGKTTRIDVEPNRLCSALTPPLAPSNAPGFRLLFVGTLGYFPNQDAALFLCESVAPLARRHLGEDFRLSIIGRKGPSWLMRRLARCPMAEVMTDVEDLQPYYRQAQAVAIPLRCGGGTKLKLLEAFLHGRPVIATKHGVRGTTAIDGTHYLAAENALDFVLACCRLNDNAGEAHRQADAAHALLGASYLLPGRSATPSPRV